MTVSQSPCLWNLEHLEKDWPCVWEDSPLLGSGVGEVFNLFCRAGDSGDGGDWGHGTPSLAHTPPSCPGISVTSLAGESEPLFHWPVTQAWGGWRLVDTMPIFDLVSGGLRLAAGHSKDESHEG